MLCQKIFFSGGNPVVDRLILKFSLKHQNVDAEGWFFQIGT